MLIDKWLATNDDIQWIGCSWPINMNVECVCEMCMDAIGDIDSAIHVVIRDFSQTVLGASPHRDKSQPFDIGISLFPLWLPHRKFTFRFWKTWPNTSLECVILCDGQVWPLFYIKLWKKIEIRKFIFNEQSKICAPLQQHKTHAINYPLPVVNWKHSNYIWLSARLLVCMRCNFAPNKK